MQLDIENAFNTLNRQRMLEAVAARAPSLLPFAAYMYAQPSTLYISGAHEGTQPILSEQGVRQGDPCAPLFFALSIQDALLEASADSGHAAPPLAYADDVTLQGSVEAAVTAVQSLRPKLARQGLRVNLRKCKVYSANEDLAEETANRLGLGPDCVAASGLVIAGTPIGTDEFIAEYAEKRVGATSQAIADLQSLGLSAQEKFVILHQCLQHRDTHLMRTTPWTQVQPALDRLTSMVITAVQNIAGIGEEEFQLHHRQQMQLPLRAGGFGIVVFDQHRAGAAFLAAAALAQITLERAPERFQPLQGPQAQALWDQFS